MNVYRTIDLHPITLASIEREAIIGLVSGDKQCGCHRRPPGSDTWWLCTYHVGYDDGIKDLLAAPEGASL